MRTRAFLVNKFSLICRCSLLNIHYCLLDIMHLTPDPVLIFVTLSWPRFLTLSRTSVTLQVSLLVSLSVNWYNIAQIQIHYLTISKHWAGQNMWIKPQRLVCMTRMISIMSASLVFLLFVRVYRRFRQVFSHITTVSVCDGELNAHFYCDASLKYHAQDTWHDTIPSHIILILPRPVLALPRKSEC